ncbi:MAG: hypothetical protein ABI169_15700 [Chitinophagaceae bacterium]
MLTYRQWKTGTDLWHSFKTTPEFGALDRAVANYLDEGRISQYLEVQRTFNA